ncbi:MAG: VOC family protein [Pseudomonadota bacterium]
MVQVFRKDHGFQVDHIGLAVPDTRQGVEWMAAETDARVHLKEALPSNWFWSGVLPIGGQSFLEVIGPNPNWPKFHPLRAFLSELTGPTLMFWYVSVDSLDAFTALAKSYNLPMRKDEDANLDNANPGRSAYRRGHLGPGFITERPNVIEWVRHVQLEGDPAPQCRLTGFELAHPDATQINASFEKLGIDVHVFTGPSRIKVTLDTPNGPWSLENPGVAFTMPGMLAKMAGLWWRHRRA